MKPVNNIEKLIKNTNIDVNQGMSEVVFKKMVEAYEKSEKKKGSVAQPNIWRIIMNNKLTKLSATAVAVIIAVIIATQFFTATNISLAQAFDNMRKMPWMHITTHTTVGKIPNSTQDQWICFNPQINARINFFGEITYAEIDQGNLYLYDPDSQSINLLGKQLWTKGYIHQFITPPEEMLKLMIERFSEQNAQMNQYSGLFQENKVEVFDFFIENQEYQTISKTTAYVDPDTLLIVGIDSLETNFQGDIQYQSTESYEYPPVGPGDIYDLGAPPSAKVFEPELLQRSVIDSRNDFPSHYFAVRFTESSGLRKQYELNLFCKKGNLTRSDIYILPEIFDANVEITYETVTNVIKQKKYRLRSSAISDGTIEHHVTYDPILEPIYKQLVSNNRSLMVSTGWGSDEKISLYIIENDFSRENNLICVANGWGRPPPGEQEARFYYDPDLDYLRVKMTIREPDMAMDWDWTDFAQTPDGHWYPTREEQHIKTPYDDINTTRTFYLNTNPQFSEDILDPDKMSIDGDDSELAKQVALCAGNLYDLAEAVRFYQVKNPGMFPATLTDLVETGECDFTTLLCPGSPDEVGECSYIYRIADARDRSSEDMIIAYDKIDNHNGQYRNVLFVRTQVKKMTEQEFTKAIAQDNAERRKLGLPEKPVVK